jgi:hypothetical protein
MVKKAIHKLIAVSAVSNESWEDAAQNVHPEPGLFYFSVGRVYFV